jgi:hypothetical protein
MSDKKEKRRFDKALLDECIKRDGATLISKYCGGGRRTIIHYKCKCGNERQKTFCLIANAGALCKDCVHKKQVERLAKGRTEENKQKALQTRGDPEDKSKTYSRKALDECIERDKAQLIGLYPKLFGTTLIKIKCCCGSDAELQFQDIMGRNSERREKQYCGALCVDCNKKRWLNAREETNMKLYGKKGGINYTEESREKGVRTSMEKYNVASPNQAEIVKLKKIETCQKNWGVDNPAQSQEVQEKTQKNAKKYKEYKMPSGTLRKVQGYEPFALDTLVKAYTEDQIKTDRKDVPRIKYEVGGKNKYHYPDIFIPHENKLIEVKSTWTYSCKTDNIQLKKKYAEEQGFIYEIWCYNAKGEREKIPSI